MKIHLFACILVLIRVLTLPVTSNAQAISSLDTNQPGLKVRSAFNGTVTLRGRSGDLPVPFKLYNFSIWGPRQISGLRSLAEGLAIIRFNAGKTETVIQETTNRNKPGDILLLERDSTARFRATSEASTFQALVLGGVLGEAKLTASHDTHLRPTSTKYHQKHGGPLETEIMPMLDTDEFSLQTQSLLIGPGHKTSAISLPGAAILEVNCGKGVLRIGDRAQKVQGGSVLTMKDGEPLIIQNERDDLGLSIRITILRVK
jgi:hypothetical protein